MTKFYQKFCNTENQVYSSLELIQILQDYKASGLEKSELKINIRSKVPDSATTP